MRQLKSTYMENAKKPTTESKAEVKYTEEEIHGLLKSTRAKEDHLTEGELNEMFEKIMRGEEKGK